MKITLVTVGKIKERICGCPLHTENGCVHSGAGGGIRGNASAAGHTEKDKEKMASGMGTVNFHGCRYVFGIIRIERRMEG